MFSCNSLSIIPWNIDRCCQCHVRSIIMGVVSFDPRYPVTISFELCEMLIFSHKFYNSAQWNLTNTHTVMENPHPYPTPPHHLLNIFDPWNNYQLYHICSLHWIMSCYVGPYLCPACLCTTHSLIHLCLFFVKLLFFFFFSCVAHSFVFYKGQVKFGIIRSFYIYYTSGKWQPYFSRMWKLLWLFEIFPDRIFRSSVPALYRANIVNFI